MNRAAFYIDGFNLYHSFTSNRHKWLDIKKLAHNIVSSKERIVNICYFSALCTWDADKCARHQNLIDIYNDFGVDITLGRFKKVDATCNKKISYRFCDHRYQRHSEKQTDVNIAIRMLKDAYEDKIERAYLLSHDTDLIPAVKAIQSLGVKTMFLFPPETQNAEEFKSIGMFRKLKESDYDNAILPDKIILSDNRTIERPVQWR